MQAGHRIIHQGWLSMTSFCASQRSIRRGAVIKARWVTVHKQSAAGNGTVKVSCGGLQAEFGVRPCWMTSSFLERKRAMGTLRRQKWCSNRTRSMLIGSSLDRQEQEFCEAACWAQRDESPESSCWLGDRIALQTAFWGSGFLLCNSANAFRSGVAWRSVSRDCEITLSRQFLEMHGLDRLRTTARDFYRATSSRQLRIPPSPTLHCPVTD